MTLIIRRMKQKIQKNKKEREVKEEMKVMVMMIIITIMIKIKVLWKFIWEVNGSRACSTLTKYKNANEHSNQTGSIITPYIKQR